MNRNIYPVTGFHKHRKPLDRESARRELARDIVALNRRMLEDVKKGCLKQPKVPDMDTRNEDKDNKPAEIQPDIRFGETEEHAQMFMGMMARFSPDNSIADKITSEHLDKQLDNLRIETEKFYEVENEKIKDRKHGRITYTIFGGAAIVAAVVLLIAFKDNPEAISDIIEKLVVAAVSAVGGYGFGKYRGRDDD